MKGCKMNEITEQPTIQPKESRGVIKEREANAWSEKLNKEKKTPEQVVGELIAGGAHVGNYASSAEKGWNPEAFTVDSGRKMIGFSDGAHIGMGIRLGKETLKKGLDYATQARGSTTLKAESLYMVPYPKFSEGKVDATKSFVFLLHEEQVNNLKGLVAEPSNE